MVGPCYQDYYFCLSAVAEAIEVDGILHDSDHQFPQTCFSSMSGSGFDGSRIAAGGPCEPITAASITLPQELLGGGKDGRKIVNLLVMNVEQLFPSAK